ncbi:hypothetical protein BC834DRAFT_871342 [Gloeopeniophorella convolvens]|nr:hypothetical protein BC834DRAFT_871342 [Gloeopeniophorella convolvens]
MKDDLFVDKSTASVESCGIMGLRQTKENWDSKGNVLWVVQSVQVLIQVQHLFDIVVFGIRTCLFVHGHPRRWRPYTTTYLISESLWVRSKRQLNDNVSMKKVKIGLMRYGLEGRDGRSRASAKKLIALLTSSPSPEIRKRLSLNAEIRTRARGLMGWKRDHEESRCSNCASAAGLAASGCIEHGTAACVKS